MYKFFVLDLKMDWTYLNRAILDNNAPMALRPPFET